ncbi:HEXXH motif domain protein [Halobacteriovorax sp. BALOs_7]|uniref:aKG-HExxH-type peptide beta-hydroxylase n=1 Tax=Halobacteriovorax sp. BALOs_7 TaxID=2109558 RepID=UPI000EA100B2|nr:HEXXH motif-containing putative peptide modification protein [Halobacteriovorax sp. BALOs_7]AYF45952.1 HEXXH motif domain protein [Halobacteriovorax sp. BALOs_7]
MKQFNQFIQNNNSFKESYLETLALYREDASSDVEESNEYLSQRFQDFYKEAIFSTKLDSYSNLNFYWFNLIEALIEIISYHSEFEVGQDYEMSESEDAIFNFWHDSNLAKSFLNSLSETKDLLAESKKLVHILEDNIISFFKIHILEEVDQELRYLNVPELGDDNVSVYQNGNRILFDKLEDKVLAHINENSINKHALSTKIDDLTIIFYSDLEDSSSFMTEKIAKAYERLRKYTPDLFEVFKTFTNNIIPIKEKGIVSYSMQTLPGYSSINTFDRDDIDLMDDLLHENGHHVLNSYLNQNELLEELEEKIYYSPWRRALRPIRGIYHAYMTFYWALELFSSLSKQTEHDFTENEFKKIQERAIEEYYMLVFCELDLEKAYKEEIISTEGHEIYLVFKEMVASHRNHILNLEKSLSSKIVEDIKNDLFSARNRYY